MLLKDIQKELKQIQNSYNGTPHNYTQDDLSRVTVLGKQFPDAAYTPELLDETVEGLTCTLRQAFMSGVLRTLNCYSNQHTVTTYQLMDHAIRLAAGSPAP